MITTPLVPRRWLFFCSGIVWTCAGLILCGKAIDWLTLLPFNTGLPLESTAILIAGSGYFWGFTKIVQRNVNRINQLPDLAPLHLFIAPRGYIMILIMVSTGITLRNSPLPKVYLTIPYLAMGGVLLIGSVRFYKEFLRSWK
ncbi:MAG: hypothetical protein ACHQQQ_00385 [Bacteroidota bacterium]